MDPDTEIQAEYLPLLRIYKSGRVERLLGTDIVPAGLDLTTGVNSKDVTIDSDNDVSARLYLPKYSSDKKLPVLVYYHGGGFAAESAFSPTYHPFLNSLSYRANILAVSVNYRLAPEHLLPTAYDDSWTALKWTNSSGADSWIAEHGDFSRVFVAGDSAGANIAHHMAMRAAGVLGIEGMVLIHPFFWGSEPIGSEMREENFRGGIERFWKMVNPSGVDVDNARINVTAKDAPGLAGMDCSKVMVVVAEKDFLAERGRAYFEALKGSGWGGAVEAVESEGEEHVFHLIRPECEKALELMERLVAFFK